MQEGRIVAHGHSTAIPDLELSVSVSWGTDMEPVYFVLEAQILGFIVPSRPKWLRVNFEGRKFKGSLGIFDALQTFL